MVQIYVYRRQILRRELLVVGIAIFVFAILFGLAVSAALFLHYMYQV